ncbi:succinylglutamate desuccinylase/aspartoacylase family protein [Sorangium sp. So ce1099]|uniref:succinylglutamate desuccinylase/aspartoacylase family protein n=1 Tax=Sorangium sp. So ce1099 TaxID=3133331 RepID=UPI003F613E3C
MKTTFHHIEVGEASSLTVRIPVVGIGTGEPVLTCICGVHGDETTSVAASQRLVEQILACPEIRGTVRIVTAANPMAQAVRRRTAPIDMIDLNRCGQGSAEGPLTARLASAIFNLLLDSDLVIDLHEFEMDTPTMAIFIPSGDLALDDTILAHIATFAPETVWAMNFRHPEQAHYNDSLLAAVLSRGIPGFAVETSHALLASDEVIDAVASGIWRVAQKLGILAGEPVRSRPTAYRRREVTAPSAGLWIPRKRTLERVAEGEAVGRLVALDLMTSVEVISPGDGTILQTARRTVVATGSSVFALGTLDEVTTSMLAGSGSDKEGCADVGQGQT